MSSNTEPPIEYLSETIVFRSRALAVEAASRSGGRVVEGDGAWLAICPVPDGYAERAGAATWTAAGELVTDPEDVLPPVWFED